MLKLRDEIVELYRKAATSLPLDVEDALRHAFSLEEEGSIAKALLLIVLDNVKIARETRRPICQDTGVPVFFIKVPPGIRHSELRNTILEATRIATEQVP
ncbi:MAG: fumarate hydratase, partial [Nitrospirota bacterium]